VARHSAPPAAPKFLERVMGTYLRWVFGCIAAAFAYSVVVVAIAVLVRRERVGAPLGLVVYNTGSAMLLAAIVVAMIMIPYGYVVWGRQQFRFFGETAPWVVVLLRGAAIGAVLGVVLAFAWRG
jgi:hypothetical protein